MIVELISKECGDDPRTEKGRRIITTFLTCFIGNDVLTGVTSENIKMPMKYRNGAPFSLLSCGSLTPLLAFAGLTEEGQRTITQGQIEHKLLTVDKYKFVGDAINFWKTIAASCRSFEEFEEKCSNLIKIDIQKNIVGLVFNTEQLDLISTILTNRIATLKSIFSSEAYGFKAFCTLLGTLTHHKGLWNNKESVQTALHAAQIDPKSEYFVVYASNLVEVETIHRDNPDRSIDSFIAETVRKYGNSLDTLLRLNPDLVIVNSESQHRVLFRTVQSVLTYFSKEPEL